MRRIFCNTSRFLIDPLPLSTTAATTRACGQCCKIGVRGGWIEKIAVGSTMCGCPATVQFVKCFRDGDPTAATATAVAAVEDSAVEHLEVELLLKLLLLLLLMVMVMCLEGVTAVSLGGRTSCLLSWDVVAECGERLGETHVLATAPTAADSFIVKIIGKHRRNSLRRRVDWIVGCRGRWWEPR